MKNKSFNLLLAGAMCLSLTTFTAHPVQAQTTATDISTHATSTTDSTTDSDTNEATDSVVTVKDGEYTVDAKFLKEGSTTETSMANLALNGASLKVENGKITVFLNMQEMEMYGMKATVDGISYQDVDGTWQESAITQIENNIPTQFSFVLPENKSYTAIKFFYLGHDATARLYLDLANIVEVMTVDKTGLKTLIDQVSAYNQADYTSASFQVLEGALNTANTVYANENATQDEVDEQVELLNKAKTLVEKLGLHFRVSKLAAADCSHSMARTYDIEVYLPSIGIYKEVSSVSNARSYQARRGMMRYRGEDRKLHYMHTLNGSGLATSRVFPAILEQYQQEDGSVIVPEVLRPYMGGIEVIKPIKK